MDTCIRFCVYNHKLTFKDNNLLTRKFIVLKNKQGLIVFTDFHKYIRPPRQTVRNISDDGNNRFDFIVKLLNFAFFDSYNIKALDELNVDIVKDFLNAYGKGTLPGDSKGRTRNTVETCIRAIMDFLEIYLEDKHSKSQLKKGDLFKMVPKRNKHGKIVYKKVPVFEVNYHSKHRAIFRDMPNIVFEILFTHIATYHKDLLMLVALSAFAGLRPSEACNVRREDSPLGPGILFSIYDDEVRKIEIDLSSEQCLRSDLIPTGKIKKERKQTVPLLFTDAFVNTYNQYMTYMDGRKYEAAYGALSVNRQGKAITYDNYYQKFRKIVKEELIPILLSDEDPEVINYGRLLLENNISPHIFRHWYTVQLVLTGMDNVSELMQARGDSHPESALVYLQNKGDIEKQYRKVNNEMFDYIRWAAKKKHMEATLYD